MRESLNKLRQSQIDSTNIQHWPDDTSKTIGGQKKRLHTHTYTYVRTKQDIFDSDIKLRIQSTVLRREKERREKGKKEKKPRTAMGGTGSGRKGIKLSTAKKYASNAKFPSNLTILGFANSSKSSTSTTTMTSNVTDLSETNSNAASSNDKTSNHANVIPSTITPTKDANVNMTVLGYTNCGKSSASTATTSTTSTTTHTSDFSRGAAARITPTKDTTWTTVAGTKNTSTNKDRHMNIGMFPGLADSTTPTKAPVEKPMIQSKQQEVEDATAVTYKIQVLYRTKVNKKDINIPEKMKCLMARCFHFDKTLQLYPYDNTNKSNPITTSKDIPSDTETFQLYVPDASINHRTKMLRMSFKLKTTLQLWQLKNIPGIRNYIHQYSIYLNQTYLVTFDNVKVGGLILAHPQFTRRDIATRDLNRRLNENEEKITPIQLAPSTLWNTKGNKISTKVLAVECSKENASLVKQRLNSKLLNVPEHMQFTNTRFFRYLPFNATESVTDKVLRAGIYLQNKYLIQTTAITIMNIKRLDWVVPNQTDTFQALVLDADIPNTESKMFTSVEMGMMDNRAHLLTTKSALEEAKRWVDELVRVMRNLKETPEFWMERTGFTTPPESIDKPATSDAQVAYGKFLEQTILPLVGDDIEDSGAKQAPTRRSYSRVVYGKNENENEVSTITSSSQTNDNGLLQKTMTNAVQNMQEETKKNQIEMKQSVQKMQEESKKGQQEMRQSLLAEMRSIKEDHTSRTERMEDAIEVFDHMVKELHESNKEKSKEMAMYQQRLDQISTTTALTSSKVDDLSTAMNTKVDKLNLTMKAFINVVADAIAGENSKNSKEQQQQHLIELSKLLEDDIVMHAPDMEMEETSEVSDDNNITPSPGTTDALGGEGSAK